MPATVSRPPGEPTDSHGADLPTPAPGSEGPAG
jgi:hypothetical protein